MKLTKALLALTLVSSIVGCSNQSRTSAEMAAEEDIFGPQGVFFEIQNNSGNGLLGTLSVDAFTVQNSAFLYHARETAGRPAASILSVGDMSALHNTYVDDLPSSQIGLINIDVLFIDSMDQNGNRSFALAMKLVDSLDPAPLYISGSSQQNAFKFTDDSFETVIQMQNGSALLVRTSDISDRYNNELSDAIKLSLYEQVNGGLRYIGQISTMRGYGNK